MKTLLHVGCGSSNITHLPFYLKDGDWCEIRYDISESASPDIVGSLQDMSIIEDGSIDSLYSSHNIEHVSSFEVENVLCQFRRVLRNDGFAAVLCPDIISVAQAIASDNLESPLYVSPAGPINAIDILYGYQVDIERGNTFMAHKMAFSAKTLSASLLAAGFEGVIVARDKIFGLHAIATPNKLSPNRVETLIMGFFPPSIGVLEVIKLGCYAI